MELNPESKAASVRLFPSCIKRRTFLSLTVERYFEKLVLKELEKYLEWVTESKALYDELKNIDLLKLQVRPEKFDDEE